MSRWSIHYRTKAVVNVVYSQGNSNKYRIDLKSGRALELCVAHKEEDSYTASIERLRRKIYGFNRLGVALTAKVKSVDAKTRKQQDKQFAKEMPPREFTLEKAIAAVLGYCGLELNDQTEYESQKVQKAKWNFAPVRDENIFCELAKLISGGNESVVSEVFSHIEHWEAYVQNNGGERGLNESTSKDEARWLAMLDTLEKYGYVEEIDWKEDAKNIAHCLDRIKDTLGITLDTAPSLDMFDAHEEIATLETGRSLNLIGLTVSNQHWDLCSIDIDGDSYPICLLPHKTYLKCEELLQNTAFSISTY